MTTLYRKYRPQTFAEIVDQKHIVETLQNEITTGKIAHAYLFSGPRGVGKTTIARILAKALNCADRREGSFEPCNKCSSCEEIGNGRNIDVIEIDAASHTGVDNVRENIIENAQFKPTRSKYKVFIIDEVHMLSTSAFNALLKTLEEPPAHAIFVLATTELHKLPATIVSRCQRFHFKKIAEADMRGRLEQICRDEKIKIDEEVLSRIIRKSEGCQRDAESLLGQIFSLNLKKIGLAEAELVLPSTQADKALEFIGFLSEGQTEKALALIGSLADDGQPLDQFFQDLIEALRQIMIYQTGAKTTDLGDYSESAAKEIKKLAKDIKPHDLLYLIDLAMKRRLELRIAPVPQLPLELLAVEYANIPLSPTCLPAGRDGAGGVAKDNNHLPTQPLPAEKPQVKKIADSNEAGVKPVHHFTDSLKGAISAITHKTPPKTTLEEITQKWDELANKISEGNPSLVFILKMCHPEKIDADGLLLTAPYLLHCDKINEPKNRKALENALQEIFNEKISLYCEMESKKQNTDNSPELSSLAADFGGEIVA